MRVTDRGGQLAFPLRLEGLKHFENFHTGANTELVSRLEALVAARGTLGYWLWGQAGRGRSHLLQASCQHAEQLGYRAAYLPLDLLPRDSLILDGLETDLLAVDDVDGWLGDEALEANLMALYQKCLDTGASLIFSAEISAQRCNFALADLGSRLRALAGFEVLAPDDEGLKAVLADTAARQGLELTPGVLDYWLHRSARSLPALLAQLEHLDARALAEQRRVTIPLIKEVLAL
jgi:DnaA family protein